MSDNPTLLMTFHELTLKSVHGCENLKNYWVLRDKKKHVFNGCN